MNRLSYGAAGLLLALSLTAIISSTSADPVQHPDIDKYVNSGIHDIGADPVHNEHTEEKHVRRGIDDKYVKRGKYGKGKRYNRQLLSGRAEKLLGQRLQDVMVLPDKDKRQYILDISEYLNTHEVFAMGKTDKKEHCEKHEEDARCLATEQIRQAVTGDKLKGKTTEALNSYVRYFYKVAYVYLHHFQKGINRQEKIKEAEDHANFKDEGYDSHVNKEKAYEELVHYKSAFKSRQQWDDAYAALPLIRKYARNGLHPGIKEKLHKKLRVAFTKEENKLKYEKAKQASASHLQAIAKEAKIEAIGSSHTSASEFLKNDPTLHNILVNLHNHIEFDNRLKG